MAAVLPVRDIPSMRLAGRADAKDASSAPRIVGQAFRPDAEGGPGTTNCGPVRLESLTYEG